MVPPSGECLWLSQVPVMKPLPVVNMCQADSDSLRAWAASYGATVRQRTVCQVTTVARHSTLPEFMYQRQCEIFENPVFIAFNVQSDETSDNAAVNQLEAEEGVNFDESSGEEDST